MTNLIEIPDIELPPTDLIYDDGEPMESNRHRIAMNALIIGVEQAYSHRNDFFAGGNMFIYYSTKQVKNKDFKGPDFFVVLDVENTDISRQAWVVWNENGRYPDVIIELMSPSTAKIDKTEKKELYQKVFKTREYFVFDPFDPNSLQGWRLNGLTYQEIETDENGWLFCETLDLWLGKWEGIILREKATWLRFYDLNKNLVLLPEEVARQQTLIAQEQAQIAQEQAQIAQEQAQIAQEQAKKAEILAARLRELGENPDELLQ
jgi:Uma2 family endonuclease